MLDQELRLKHPPSLRAAVIWLISGSNLPTNAAVCSTECPPTVPMDISNPGIQSPRRYSNARKVCAGAVAIPRVMAKGSNDQFYTSESGYFYTTGQKYDPSLDEDCGVCISSPPQTRTAGHDADPKIMSSYTAIVKVDAELEGSFLMAHPFWCASSHDIRAQNSNTVIDYLRRKISGDFRVSRVDAGQFTLHGSPQTAIADLILAPQLN